MEVGILGPHLNLSGASSCILNLPNRILQHWSEIVSNAYIDFTCRNSDFDCERIFRIKYELYPAPTALRCVQNLRGLVHDDLQIVRASIRYEAVKNLKLGVNWILDNRSQVIPAIETKRWIGGLVVFVQRERRRVTCW